MSFAMALDFDRSVLARAVLAGGAWGLTLAAGLYAMTYAQCEVICLDNVAFTTLTCIAAGIVTIGPLAAFGRR